MIDWTTLSPAAIHHEYTLRQLAADRANEAVFEACHDPGHRGSHLAAARSSRHFAEASVGAFYATHAVAIAAHIATFTA